ncbi:MAG: hypothetical protein IJ347_03160, partial [Faecalibacterium sp.]|nr:hypothetical protein [Faecalibacterium sp.]
VRQIHTAVRLDHSLPEHPTSRLVSCEVNPSSFHPLPAGSDFRKKYEPSNRDTPFAEQRILFRFIQAFPRGRIAVNSAAITPRPKSLLVLFFRKEQKTETGAPP